MAKVWSVKRWETKGLQQLEGQFSSDVNNNLKVYFKQDGSWGVFLRMGRDAFENKADAAKRAEELRLKKIANLEKKIQKLKDMTFEEA